MRYRLWSATGTCVAKGELPAGSVLLDYHAEGFYLLEVEDGHCGVRLVRVVKEG